MSSATPDHAAIREKEGHDHAHDHAHDHGQGHQHPHDHAHGHQHDHPHVHASPSACCGGGCGAPAVAPAPDAAVPAGAAIATYRIDAMDCPTEETLIRNKLGSMAGVAGLQFNLMQRVLTVHHTLDSLEPVVRAIESLGMKAEPLSEQAAELAPQAARPWWPLALAGAAALGAEAVGWLGVPGQDWLAPVLALAAVAIAGLGVYKKGWIALSNGNLNINALMSIAVTGAMVIRQWPEAAMVMVLFALAERIEAASLDRARNAVRGLMAMAPEQATVRQADGSWQAVDARAVAVGALVRLRPGERVALDGRVLRGQSTLDQAPITGESVPVDKGVGDALFAGTINQAGELEYEVTAAASGSTLARIIHAVEAAQGSRAPTQRFVDRFARVYTPLVFLGAVLVAVVPPLALGGDWSAWVYKALVLLVIACPCALVISTPVTIVSGLAAAARRGILIKGGVYLEQGKDLAWLALDKTGTITHGKPAQTDFQPLGEVAAGGAAASAAARAVAASLAGRSDHPVSMAVASAARAEGIAPLDVQDFAALPGYGVSGTVNGRAYYLGNHRLIHDRGLCSPELEATLEALERQGKTVVVLGADHGVEALFGVADTVKDHSRQAVAELHALGVRTLMLSGDNPHTAQAIATQVQIDEARGNQLPQDKADAIAALSVKGGEGATGGAGRVVVGMVGDGVNDAPALARADIGFAMGAAGTDTAIETADVALMDDDLRKIPTFIRLSRRTSAVLKQNIVLALGIKVVFLVLTAAGLGTMWMAVFADMGASLLVVFNGLRLAKAGRG
ncbi:MULTISPECIES: heavy metal translocating P-type ATPase [Cupriavidus]